MRITESALPFTYKTIRLTQSRLNKGLLAVPVTLLDYFPKKRTTVDVFMGTSSTAVEKTFTPYSSSSGECRIGGMRPFYEHYRLMDGDEIVVQFLADGKFRFMTEEQYEAVVKRVEKEFDVAENEDAAAAKLRLLSGITCSSPTDTLWSEYFRLSRAAVSIRTRTQPRPRSEKESAPPSLRRLLTDIYGGRCQVTGFGFLQKNGKPYFEIHHVRPELGNHLKNVLVVSPNTHAEFTHAFVETFCDKEGWLRSVKFNDTEFPVTQVIDRIPSRYEKEVHSEAL
jgi:hypothetical protein